MSNDDLRKLLETLREYGVCSYRQGDLALVFGSPPRVAVAIDHAPDEDEGPSPSPEDMYEQWKRELLHSSGGAKS